MSVIKSMMRMMIRLIKIQILVVVFRTLDTIVTTKKFISSIIATSKIVSQILLMLQLLEEACVLLYSLVKVSFQQLSIASKLLIFNNQPFLSLIFSRIFNLLVITWIVYRFLLTIARSQCKGFILQVLYCLYKIKDESKKYSIGKL